PVPDAGETEPPALSRNGPTIRPRDQTRSGSRQASGDQGRSRVPPIHEGAFRSQGTSRSRSPESEASPEGRGSREILRERRKTLTERKTAEPAARLLTLSRIGRPAGTHRLPGRSWQSRA